MLHQLHLEGTDFSASVVGNPYRFQFVGDIFVPYAAKSVGGCDR